MYDSLTQMKRVSHQTLRGRLETVKQLEESELEGYEVTKDRDTGEHYLLYWYNHLQIADGHKETYYHLMPIGHDDVLAIVLGEQPYSYPDHWKGKFLRNSGEDEGYIWFDPSGIQDTESYEKLGEQMKQKLAAFKQSGSIDPEAVRRLLEDMDKMN